MANKKIGWGILGTSFISEKMALAIQSSDKGELIGLGSRSDTTGKLFSEKFNIPKHYKDYDDLLRDEEIRAIYIGLPNHLHKEWIIRAAKAGKHILCEKPFVLTVKEAEEALNVVKEANVFCMEALMYRYHPFTTKLQELIRSNIIGEVKLFNATYTANIVGKANATAGGSIRNLGCYPISLVRLLADAEPIAVSAMGRLNAASANDSQASALLKFPNEVMAVVSTADDIEMFSQFDVYGTKGNLKVLSNPWLPELDNNKILIQRNDEEAYEINVVADKPLYSYQIDTLSNKILDTNYVDNTIVSGEDSLGNIAVLESWLKAI